MSVLTRLGTNGAVGGALVIALIAFAVWCLVRAWIALRGSRGT